jgi:myo-inositol-1(or 4)-monophosphatase
VTKEQRPDLSEHLTCAHALADASAAAILPYFRTAMAVNNKAKGRDFDPVTAADQAAEAVIAKYLKEKRPEHGIVGEEFGNHQAGARFKWVIDPIDGTRSFIIGTPMWGTLIGLLDGAEPILGIMNQPYTGERFWSDGSASFMSAPALPSPTRLATRRCPILRDAVLASTHPDIFAPGPEREAFTRVKTEAKLTRYGGDCYAYCMLAAGFVDVIIETSLQPYDVVALIPIVEHAGGRMTTWSGGSAAGGGQIVACGDPALHAKVIDLLAG